MLTVPPERLRQSGWLAAIPDNDHHARGRGQCSQMEGRK